MNSDEKQAFIETLTQIKRGKTFRARPNTWEWAEDIRKDMLTDTDNYPWRSACEELWSQVTDIQDDKYLNIERSETSGLHPIEALSHWIEIPRYPPIEVLMAISDAFDIYMAANGELTLEDVFFGPTKKGVGNYASRKARDDVFRNFHMYISLEVLSAKHKNEKLSDMETLASDYLAYGKNPFVAKALKMEPDYDNGQDPDSFLRGYRRWKKEILNKSNKTDN